MDFHFDDKIKKDDEAIMSQNQKDTIYNEHLVPLKTKISQILLYDSESALTFLQQYNELTKNEENLGLSIIAKIVDLEEKIREYEESKGKEKLYNEQSRTLVQQLEELQNSIEQLSAKEFESEFSNIKEIYSKNLEGYNYSDRDVIEQNISAVQAKLIMKKVQKGALDLYNEISKEDEERLAVVINTEIYKLMQSGNQNVQDIVNEIKYKMLERTDAVYDPEIWRLLDAAQRNEKRPEKIENKVQQPSNERSNQTAALATLPNKKRKFELPNFSEIFQKTLKIGDQKMKLSTTVQLGDITIKPKELAKIDMDWLAKQVPKEMLEEIEENKLRDEAYYGKAFIEAMEKNNGKYKANTISKEKFMPDSKTPIYMFIQKEVMARGCYRYYNDKGVEVCITYISSWCEAPNLKTNNEIMIRGKYDRFDAIRNNIDIIEYAKLIDKITGSNLQQQLLNELGTFVEKQVLRRDIPKDDYMDKTKYKELMRKLPIYSNLAKSYKNVRREAENTIIFFSKYEDARRKEFYNQQKEKEEFRAKLRETETELGEFFKERKNKKHKQYNQSHSEKEDGTDYRGG